MRPEAQGLPRARLVMKICTPTFNLISLLAGLLLPGLVSAESLHSEKVAIIDTQRVINDSIVGKAARSNLEDQIKKSKLKLSSLKADLDKQKSELEKQASILSGSALEERRESLSKKQVAFERAYQDMQEQLGRLNETEIGKVLKEIQQVVKEVAKQQGYGVVLERDRQSVLYAAPRLEITQDVISILDKKKVDL